MTFITSLQNPLIKLIRSLQDKTARKEAGLFVAEGGAMLATAQKAGWVPDYFLSTCPQPDWGNTAVTLVSEKVMAHLSRQANPHAVLAVFPSRYSSQRPQAGLWVVLEDIRDPGNLGTIIRSACAVHAEGLILLGQSCDPFAGEVVRASVGTIFNLPLLAMALADFHSFAKAWPGDVVATELRAAQDFRQTYSRDCLLVMGNEAKGLSADLIELCTKRVRIPMHETVESLNLAQATTLMLYEISRTRL